MKPLVYYLDDSPDNLKLYEWIAHGDNRFRFKTFQTIEKLMYELEKEKPELIVLDLMLNYGLTGSLIAEKLREEYPDIKLIIFTSYDIDRAKKLVSDGIDDLELWSKQSVDINSFNDKLAETLYSVKGE